MLEFIEIIGFGFCMCVTMHQKSSAISKKCLHGCVGWGQLALD